MPTYNLRGNNPATLRKELNKLLAKHNRERHQRVRAAVVKAAIGGKKYIAAHTIPIAFKELVDSLDVQFVPGQARAQIVATAPHARAVELGTRPHTPPLEPLIAWVRLRGMQGLQSRRRLKGSTSAYHAGRVATLIRSMEKGGASPIDAPERIAKAIQYAISQRGTHPSRYMQRAIPFVARLLFEEVSQALPDK